MPCQPLHKIYFNYAGDVAMLIIFYHSLRLGTTLLMSWFRAIWWFYGLTLAAALIYKYRNKYFLREPADTKKPGR